MAGENTKVYLKQGGDALVVAAGGKITIEAGGALQPAAGQAAAIANLSAISGGEAPTEAEHNAVRTAVNSILTALRGAGIIASS